MSGRSWLRPRIRSAPKSLKACSEASGAITQQRPERSERRRHFGAGGTVSVWGLDRAARFTRGPVLLIFRRTNMAGVGEKLRRPSSAEVTRRPRRLLPARRRASARRPDEGCPRLLNRGPVGSGRTGLADPVPLPGTAGRAEAALLRGVRSDLVQSGRVCHAVPLRL